MLPRTPIAYSQKINQLQLGEVKNFFDKYNMMEFKLDNNIFEIKKNGSRDTLQFELHAFGGTPAVLKESKAFKIDSDSMSEVMHLTKYFGPYHITKTVENKFVFSKDGQSAVISKYKW